MTLDEFFTELAKGRGKFSLTSLGCIRAGNACPVTWMCSRKTGLIIDVEDYDCAAEEIGFDDTLADEVASAADMGCEFGDYDPSLRRRLLKTLGLKEK